MKIIIDIPEEYYKAIMEIPVNQSTTDMLIIRNGTPLPKGYGDLIDRRKVLADMSSAWVTGGTRTVMQGYVARAETIIEADKEEE